jgi:hypothetical protein
VDEEPAMSGVRTAKLLLFVSLPLFIALLGVASFAILSHFLRFGPG